jgi:LysR family transcriptional activator of nhaA
LGESGITFFAAGSCAQAYRADFPAALDGAPMLMPTNTSALRRGLELWFERIQVSPRVVAEFEDRALMKAFGEASAGIFTSPTAVEQDVLEKYGVTVIGRSEDVKERFYAISAERRIKHPAISAITAAARTKLFG